MKRLKRAVMCLLVCTLLFQGKTTGYAEEYTYTVTIYAGNQGTVKNASGINVASRHPKKVHMSVGKSKIVITGLTYGDNISCNAQRTVSVSDDRYYVMGIRLSGRDNNTIAKNAAFTVAESQDYVIAYGIAGEMTEYTVNYVDEQGTKLADSQTYQGNVGDEPVLAYLYIDGYVPVNRNITRKLEADASKNVFEFVYKTGVESDVQTVQQEDESGGNENEAGNGTDGENDGETDRTDNAAIGTLDNAGGNEEEREGEINQPVDIEDELVPQAAGGNGGSDKDNTVSRITENGMLAPVIIGSVAAVIMITTLVLFVILKKRRKNV